MNFYVKVGRPKSRPWNGKFANAVEERFAKLATSAGVSWEYENTSFGVLRPVMQEYYRPDFYLHGYGVYVEIHGGTSWDKQQRQLTPKRNKIKWLAEQTGIPVVLLHQHNWPEPRSDWQIIERLIVEAQTSATALFDGLRGHQAPDESP